LAEINVRKIIRSVLQYGVALGIAFVLAGVILSFGLERFLFFPMSYIISLAKLNLSLVKFTLLITVTPDVPLALMSIGIIIFIFIPIARAILTVMMFAVEKDRLYSVLCAVVVAIVLLAFFVVGPFMHGVGR